MNTYEYQISRAFNKAATTYNQHARVQIAAGQLLIRQITATRKQFNHVFDAGCGTGLITQMLADTIQHESLLAVDIAAALLAQAISTKKISFQKLNFNDASAHSKNHDLIFSNMALHWSESFTRTLDIFHSALASDGILAFTIPLQGTFSEISDRFATHEFMSLSDAQETLQYHGYHLLQARQQTYHDSFHDTHTALHSIKLAGANYVKQPSHKSLRGKSFINKLLLEQLSYVIGFFIAEKTT